jgi:hypothetical protein
VLYKITTFTDVYYHFECVSDAQHARFANPDGSLSGKIRLHSSLSLVQQVEVKSAISAAHFAAKPAKKLTKKEALTKKMMAAKRFRLRQATRTAAGPSQVDNDDSEDIGESENGESELSGTEYDPKA